MIQKGNSAAEDAGEFQVPSPFFTSATSASSVVQAFFYSSR
jgi:hypothetical protein